METPSEARLPEWSKGVDSSSTVQEYSWVQIPQRAFFFEFFIIMKLSNMGSFWLPQLLVLK